MVSDFELRSGFYQALTRQHGVSAEAQQFYVPIYDMEGMKDFDLVLRMQRQIELSTESVRLFSGFRGCGKTSELARLRNNLLSRGYTVAYMDIENYFNTQLPMDSSLLPIALAAGFAEAVGQKLGESAGQRFRNFIKRINVEPTVGVKFGAGGAEGAAEIRAVIKDDESFASKARETFKTNRRVLRQEFHSFFQDLLSKLENTSPVVFIVDSIDHWRGSTETFEEVRDSVEKAFAEFGDDLHIPSLHAIYTIPIYLTAPGLGTRYDVVNIKLHHRSGEPFAPGYDALKAVLRRRIPSGNLDDFLPEDQLETMLTASGGQFRDLFRLAGETLLAAEQLPATARDLALAISSAAEDFGTVVSAEQRQILLSISQTHEAFVPGSAISDFQALVTLGMVLRYPNQRTWYDVHPLVRPMLRDSDQ